MNLFGFQYNPQNVGPVLFIATFVLSIAVFVAWGFWKMASLRKTGELLTSWDVEDSPSDTNVTVPRANEVLLVFLDYKHKGFMRGVLERRIVLENESDGTKYELKLSKGKDHPFRDSQYLVYSFMTKGTILGQVKDVKEGKYNVRFNESANLDGVSKIDFVLRKSGW